MTTDQPAPRRSVVVGVDGSIGNASAVAWAAAEASASGRYLTLFHVTETSLGSSQTRAASSALAQAHRLVTRGWPTLAARLATAVGTPVDALVAEAAEHDLVVLGRRGHASSSRMTWGSTSYAVSALTGTDVVVVPAAPVEAMRQQGVPAHPTTSPINGVVAIWDPWNGGWAAVDHAAARAGRDGHPLHLVVGWRPDPASIDIGCGIREVWREITDGVDGAVADLRAELVDRHPGLVLQIHVQLGHPADLVLELIDSWQASERGALVVVERGARPGLPLSALTHTLVTSAPCAVSLVSSRVRTQPSDHDGWARVMAQVGG